jgi:DnaK suppressor protein
VPEIDKEKVAARLRQRAQEIEERRKHIESEDADTRGTELADYDQHEADQGTETHDLELDQTTLLILEAELRDVRTAQQRLEEGTYGICIDCGKEIPPQRLEAIPEAIRCIEDQRLYEAQLRARGGPRLDPT